VQPIISEELWEQCNHILDEQQDKKHKRPARQAVHLFTGYIFCSCGNKMYVPSNSPKYICYKCRNKIGITDLEDVFHHQLKTFFYSPEEIAHYLSDADRIIKEKEELLKTLTEDKQKIKTEMEKTYKLYMEDQITPQGFGSLYKPLEERLKQTEDQIPELQGEIDFLKIQYLSSDQMLNQARDLYSRWPDLISEEKRKIVENITEKILIGKGDVTINLCYLPSSSELMTRRPHNFRDVVPHTFILVSSIPLVNWVLLCPSKSIIQISSSNPPA
jgi:site-specific DNA recombinase